MNKKLSINFFEEATKTMKKTLFLLLLCPIGLLAQDAELYDLRWKVSDTLVYRTVMQTEIEPGEPSEQKEDSPVDSLSINFKGMFDKIREESKNRKYETWLYPDVKGNIEVEMKTTESEKDSSSFLSSLVTMNGGTILRGKLSPEGEVISFYYTTAQNNLTSVLFALPAKKVRVGDVWRSGVNMIQMDQNFVVDSASKRDRVRLKAIETIQGRKIAVIEYDIEEYTRGGFGNSLTGGIVTIFGSEKEGIMRITHEAIGRFDIEAGRWIDYEGRMIIDSFLTMLSKGQNITTYKLIPKTE